MTQRCWEDKMSAVLLLKGHAMLQTIILKKGTENYVVLYNSENLTAALRQLGRWAGDPRLSFTWYDAAVLTQRVRQERRW